MTDQSIPYGKQHITDDDIKAVTEALISDYLTQGPRILQFEKEFAHYVGATYAVAVSNGTAALHLAALALNVSLGDKVITTPITFAASANCIKYCGGAITFVDIDAKSYLIDFVELENILKKSPKGTYKGVVVVDFAGRAANLQQLKNLANEYAFWIIEDACHAPGGWFRDSQGNTQHCGNGQFADLSVFSFHPVKHIACGEGGMITTNNEKLYQELLKLRTHGITRHQNHFINPIELAGGIDTYPGWYMEMQELGFNYRLTDFQAALGSSQLARANGGLEKRRQIAKKYADSFEGKSFLKGQSGFVEGHAYHLYIIEVENRLALYNFLKENGVFAQVHYIPCHLMPYYQKQGWKVGDMPIAEQYYRHCLSLPMYPTLTAEEQDKVIALIIGFYE